MNSTEVKTIQVVVSAVITGLLYYLGIVAVPIIILIVTMIIDYVTGMVAAWWRHGIILNCLLKKHLPLMKGSNSLSMDTTDNHLKYI